MSCLWMGNVDPYMDENFVTRAFATMGELVVSVKIIRNKANKSAVGYCFVELPDKAAAERCLRKVNGKLLPRSMPPRRFKLKTAGTGKHGDNRHVSLWCQCRCRRNESGYFDPASSQPYTCNNNQYCDFNGSQPYICVHNQYYQNCPNCYTNWGYDETAGHSSYNCYDQASEDTCEDGGLEDPGLNLDVAEANRQFMMDSEELYDAFIDCHWPAFEFPDSSEYPPDYS
ncbi:tRNA selenocysteine 1-associated protein 1-like isoform X1 [Silurus meridionalis]|uniref:tRNA selenocysteine 1-associated protein 1-like isoform X1 n=1 Tax=Silurus meridionalis TaxID=175797 RepID=UPI001EEA6AEF|nr:tRNA selenocysteine 1-associated protein 1-like isoform X1 [Silurus meridionalis]XP_046702228.1 tRNA selenocysteine 1-associated protein 1-like isoform X1 [Silurus meridionalis]XP_046702230.1 tRNA selenocysteine 1-associated protein 1-like isoform X1 [Silurus meridionalis]